MQGTNAPKRAVFNGEMTTVGPSNTRKKTPTSSSFPCKKALVVLVVALLVYRVAWLRTPPIIHDAADTLAKINTTSEVLPPTIDTAKKPVVALNADGDGDVNLSLNSTAKDLMNKAINPSSQTEAPTQPEKKVAAPEEKQHFLYDTKLQATPVLNYLNQQLSEAKEQHLGDTTLYQKQHCDLQGQPWCPSGKKKWQKHAPYFMVLGVKKAGSTSLYYALLEHPQIVTAQMKESLFFSQKRFHYDKYLAASAKDRSPRDRHYLNVTHKVKVASVREDYTKKFRIVPLMKDPDSISFDATPQYIFNFPTVPKKVLCSCPWIKLIVILRNPIGRLWSHFNFIKNLQIKKNKARGPMKTSFEEWILKDLQRMEKYKLATPADLPSTSDIPMQEHDMMKAWNDYAADFEEAPVGRGFYALQIYQWMKELRTFGRDPKHVLKIIRLEDLKRKDDNQTVATQILQEITGWLMLEGKGRSSEQQDPQNNETVDFSPGFRQRFETNYKKLGNPVLSPSTREWLDAFYAPHNQMLGRLLGNDEWNYSLNSTLSRAPMVWPPSSNETQEEESFFSASKLEDVIANDPCYLDPYK